MIPTTPKVKRAIIIGLVSSLKMPKEKSACRLPLSSLHSTRALCTQAVGTRKGANAHLFVPRSCQSLLYKPIKKCPSPMVSNPKYHLSMCPVEHRCEPLSLIGAPSRLNQQSQRIRFQTKTASLCSPCRRRCRSAEPSPESRTRAFLRKSVPGGVTSYVPR